MATTSSSDDHGKRCPLCGGQLAEDHAGRGFVRHLDRPDAATAARILADPAVAEADKQFLRDTGRCPWQRGEQDP